MADSALMGITLDRKEKWMGVEYMVEPISASQIDLWKEITESPCIQLPKPNPYIPRQLHLMTPPSESTGDPVQLLSKDEGYRVYYAQDSHFQLPEVAILFEIKSPLINLSAKSRALRLFMLGAYMKFCAAMCSWHPGQACLRHGQQVILI